MLTYRQFRPDDGVDEVDRLGQAAKPYTYFDPKLIELQKEFPRDLSTHTNPYTKLAYKDDPAIALTGIKIKAISLRNTPYWNRIDLSWRKYIGIGRRRRR